MMYIDKYKNNNNSFDVVVRNVALDSDSLRMIDNGYPLDVNLEVIDGKKITIQQRKKIFALLNDIYLFTGQPQEDLRQQFQFYLEMIKGYEPISLTDTTRRIASELIEVIIAWVFQHDIPLNYKTSDLMKEDNYFIYLSTINRTCVICGKKHADLAHRYAVGRGRNRNTIDHYGNEVLALCREHHNTQHQIGIDTFNEKYHLENSWVKVDDRLNKMLKGEKTD